MKKDGFFSGEYYAFEKNLQIFELKSFSVVFYANDKC